LCCVCHLKSPWGCVVDVANHIGVNHLVVYPVINPLQFNQLLLNY